MILKSNIVFCDGACSGNPGPGGWGALIATTQGQVTELGGSENPSTNNKMELTATIESLKFLNKVSGDITLCTDSQYVIKGITEWIQGWIRRNWVNSQKEPVANRELWQGLLEQVSLNEKQGKKIKWVYVKGHSGDAGNDRADKIAVAFSVGQTIALYKGALSEYRVKLTFPN